MILFALATSLPFAAANSASFVGGLAAAAGFAASPAAGGFAGMAGSVDAAGFGVAAGGCCCGLCFSLFARPSQQFGPGLAAHNFPQASPAV